MKKKTEEKDSKLTRARKNGNEFKTTEAISNFNRTKWSPIRSVIIPVIIKGALL